MTRTLTITSKSTVNYLPSIEVTIEHQKEFVIMPRMYEHIKENYMKHGIPENRAQSIAAATYIKKGKGGTRSSRAKALHKDSPAKGAMKHMVSSYAKGKK